MMYFLIQGHNLKENIIIINCLQDNKTIVLKVGLLFFRIRVDKIITFLGFFPFFFSQKSTCREKKPLCVRIHRDPFSLRAAWTSTRVVLQYRCSSAQGNLMWTGRNNTHKPDNGQIYSNSARRMHHTIPEEYVQREKTFVRSYTS